ncbi:prephenate dehydratase [Candida albicans SC5314]|uniref:prephenate dehydratase n=1 Tax=Candida albicans (strain SC5314 / ATCC MYA-2876) TaxID=237561 RepID=A0A1D8PJH8_CANAL|nr:prephenate dehydratase [Candida albicans SC5314]KGT69995.1 prephenate dehydratase [Candida albicans 12C]KGU10106.1 prephenate dehydratase [Candida albicans P87]KGU31079.1 prephenate dehydratase [Candida albicans P75063]KHC56635.1 prephenate dehydratase [Candida albicans P37039]AOW28281.1 prephenate dehydratase [Candida albicans SC5314]|eukprot:XP_019330844.1 prephenate dehydratase [Candida albicans SC5314]
MTIKVAFLGPEGTYTHQALIQQFGTENVSIYPQQSIGDCFHILNEKKVDYAVVPFENSTNGQVVFTYDLLRDWYFQTSTPPKFRIIAEQFVSIHHNLLTNASKIEDIKTIYSHPQVWTQVNKFLQSLPQQITKIDVGSTSKAAEIVSQDTITTSGSSSAAISSYMSSELYKLPILKEGIEDNQSNTTRFLILGYDSPISPPPAAASNNDDDNSKRNTTIVSSIMFTLNHDDPGALCDVLVKFKEYGITLTSINSRPANLKPWQYVFFVEMIGDIHQEGLVEKIKESCLELVILGVFQRSWRYNNNSNDQ